MFLLFLGTETRPIASEVEEHTTEASFQTSRTQEYVRIHTSIHLTCSSQTVTFGSKTSSKYFKTSETASSYPKLSTITRSSQSHPSEYFDTSIASILQDQKQRSLSRVEERYPLSSTWSILRSLTISLSESSLKEAMPTYGIGVSTTKHKEASTIPNKSRIIGVESSYHKQKISEYSAKEKLNLSASRVHHSTVIPAELHITSSELPGLVHSTNIYATLATVRVLPTVRPSPIPMDSFTTTKQFKSPTHLTESTTLLETGVRFLSDIVSARTVPDYGSKGSSTVGVRKLMMSSSGKETIRSSLVSENKTAQEQPKVVSSSRMSVFGGQPSSKYYVALTDGKSSDMQNVPTTKIITPSLKSGPIPSKATVISSTAHDVVLDRPSELKKDVTLTSHYSTTRIPSVHYSTISLEKTCYIVTNVFPTPFWSLMNNSLSSTVEQKSTLESAKVQSLKPLITSEYPSIFSSTILCDYKTEETVTRHKSLTSMASGTKVTSLHLMRTSVHRILQPIPSSIYNSSALFEPESTSSVNKQSRVLLVKPESTFLPWIQTVVKSLEPQFSSALKGEAVTKHVYSLTNSSSRPHVKSSLSILNTSKLPTPVATPILLSVSSILKSSFVTKAGYVSFTTSLYPQFSSPLKSEATSHSSSSLGTQSLALTAKLTSKLSTTHLATDFKQLLSVSSILKSSIVSQRGHRFLTTEPSLSRSSALKGEVLTGICILQYIRRQDQACYHQCQHQERQNCH